MSRQRTRKPVRTKSERALEEIYAKIPSIPGCDGRCAVACGPIAMFKGEWERMTRSFGSEPRMRPGTLRCPMLSPAGRCMVYTVRPYICRLWGTTREMVCPFGCEPERWLSVEEATEIFKAISAIAGPEIAGPLGGFEELWDSIGLIKRRMRRLQIEGGRELEEAVARAQELIEEAKHD